MAQRPRACPAGRAFHHDEICGESRYWLNSGALQKGDCQDHSRLFEVREFRDCRPRHTEVSRVQFHPDASQAKVRRGGDG